MDTPARIWTLTIVALLIYLAAAFFASSSWAQATRGREGTLSWLSALVGVAVFAPLTLIALYLGGLQCDESCTGDGPWKTAGSWVWHVETALGCAAGASALLGIVVLLARKTRAARVAAVLAAGFAIAWMVFGNT